MSSPDQSADPPGRAPGLIALGCASLALLFGLLGVSTKPFDPSHGFQSPLEMWLEAPAVEAAPPLRPDTGLRLGLLLIGFVLPFGAWRLASRRYGPSRSESAKGGEHTLPGQALLTREPLGLALARFVARDTDRVGNVLQRADRLLAGSAGADHGAPTGADTGVSEPLTESLGEESVATSTNPPADTTEQGPTERPRGSA